MASQPHPYRLKKAILAGLVVVSAYGVPALSANLMDMVTLAEQNDQTLQAAEQKRLSIQENTPIARANLLPQIGANAGLNYSRTDIKSNGIPGAPTVIKGSGHNLGLSLNQVIYSRIDNLNLGIADLQATASRSRLCRRKTRPSFAHQHCLLCCSTSQRKSATLHSESEGIQKPVGAGTKTL